MKLRVSWGTGIAAVYSAFAIATLGFVVFAAEQKIDLVSADYYQRALDQDRQNAAVANGSGLGGSIAVELRDRQTLSIAWPPNAPVSSGSITLYRPADSTADRVIAAAAGNNNLQTIDVSSLAEGRWRVQLRWRSGARDYYVERVIELR
jgi:hypothetical protein